MAGKSLRRRLTDTFITAAMRPPLGLPRLGRPDVELRGKKVLLTGASSGIGREFARQLAALPHKGSLTVLEADFYTLDLNQQFDLVTYWDGFGVGTSLVTGSGAPTCGFIYKLVARAESDAKDAPLMPVAKRSMEKATVGGRKYALRRLGPDGHAQAEVIGIGTPPADDGNDRALLVPLMSKGKVVYREPLTAARERPTASAAC